MRPAVIMPLLGLGLLAVVLRSYTDSSVALVLPARQQSPVVDAGDQYASTNYVRGLTAGQQSSVNGLGSNGHRGEPSGERTNKAIDSASTGPEPVHDKVPIYKGRPGYDVPGIYARRTAQQPGRSSMPPPAGVGAAASIPSLQVDRLQQAGTSQGRQPKRAAASGKVVNCEQPLPQTGSRDRQQGECMSHNCHADLPANPHKFASSPFPINWTTHVLRSRQHYS